MLDKTIIEELKKKLFELAIVTNRAFAMPDGGQFNTARMYEQIISQSNVNSDYTEVYKRSAEFADDLGGMFLDEMTELKNGVLDDLKVGDKVPRDASPETRLKDHSAGLRYIEKVVHVYLAVLNKKLKDYDSGLGGIKDLISGNMVDSLEKDATLNRIDASRAYYTDQINSMHKGVIRRVSNYTNLYCTQIKKNVDGYVNGDIKLDNFNKEFTENNATNALNCISSSGQHLDVYEGLKPIDSSVLFESYAKYFSYHKPSITSIFNGMLDQYREFHYDLYTETRADKASLLAHVRSGRRDLVNFWREVFRTGEYCITIKPLAYKPEFLNDFIFNIVSFLKKIKNYMYGMGQSTANVKPVIRKYSDIKLTKVSLPDIGTQ
jgi:hypothetical protein